MRLIQALFEALDPRSLTKNQRFTLSFNVLMLVFLGICLFTDLKRIHRDSSWLLPSW